MVLVGVVAGAVLAGCGASPRAATPTTTEPPLSVTGSTAPSPPTTTNAATTTAAATTTTTVVADATTADPAILAQQLQAVLDRYRALYSRSRANPELPFTDQDFVDKMLAVVTRDFYGVSLLPSWTAYRNEQSAVRPGPSGDLKSAITDVSVIDRSRAVASYCTYDDSVTYSLADGSVLDDSRVIFHAIGAFVRSDSAWLLDHVDVKSQETSPSGATCVAEDRS
jgi:hypothetical protein